MWEKSFHRQQLDDEVKNIVSRKEKATIAAPKGKKNPFD